jgi:hypothetical protein
MLLYNNNIMNYEFYTMRLMLTIKTLRIVKHT